MSHYATGRGYCPHCDDEREVKRTVSWQADLCRACGGDVPTPE